MGASVPQQFPDTPIRYAFSRGLGISTPAELQLRDVSGILELPESISSSRMKALVARVSAAAPSMPAVPVLCVLAAVTTRAEATVPFENTGTVRAGAVSMSSNGARTQWSRRRRRLQSHAQSCLNDLHVWQLSIG